MSHEQQAPLFDDEHADIGQLFDGLERIPPAEWENRWPGLLQEVIALFEAELCRLKLAKNTEKTTACKLAGVLAHYFGGKSFYLLAGDKIKEALRDVQLYHDFNGKNVPELVKKYKLSESAVYTVLRRQRQLQRRRYQDELPL